MTTLWRLLKWAWRAWPVVVLLVVLLVHLTLLDLCPTLSQAINKTASLVLQISGGLLVLYSIDSNIGVIRGRSLFGELRQYLAEFPLIKKSTVLNVSGAFSSTFVTKARISVKRNPKTVDEQLNYLQEQIDDTRRDLREEISDLDRKFQERSKAIDEKIGLLLASLKQVGSNVAEVSVGGIEFQVFGVLLVIYGAIAGYTV
jgi:hypothetical protein